MKSVLMIAYWFPPEGNAAVYRPLRFLRNLPAYGWEGQVVAGDSTFERYDPELARQVPGETEVVRVSGEDVWQRFQRRRAEHQRAGSEVVSAPPVTAAPAPVAAAGVSSGFRSRIRSLVRRAESCWYHPDMQRPWIGPATAATLKMCESRRPDVLWTTGPPFSAFVVAHRVAQRTGIPYVLDFRTSWTVVPSPFEAIRPAWAQQRDRRTLRRLFRDAKSVIFFYESEAECFWRIYHDVLDVARIHVIPNGFDGEVQAFAEPQNPTFTILYTGTLADYGFDGFLEGLSRFVSREPGRAEQVSVQFFGENDAAFMPRVRELNLESVVSARPPIPHAAVGEVQRRAHALLMLERRPSHKGYELLAGAKLFGYLKAGKPILGCVPPGEARRILGDVGVTTMADASSASEVEQALEHLFSHWRAGTLSSLVPDRASCERYSGRAQTAALARALEGRPALQPFTPGVHDVAPSLRAEFAAAGWA